MARKDETGETKWTLEDLRAIVAAGMNVTEARTLLEAGYGVAEVTELAQLQAAQQRQQAADAQTATAKAMQKAMRPENDTHPGISDFSYPEGDVARPKVVPPFEFMYNGYPCHKFLETEHWRECELMAQVQPGEYTILRKDLSPTKVTVTSETDPNGQITKLDVKFPVSREDKALVPSKTVVLYQLVHAHEGTPRQVFVKAMQAQLAIIADETPVTV